MTPRMRVIATLPLAVFVGGTGETPFSIDAQNVEVRLVPVARSLTQQQLRGHFEIRAPIGADRHIQSTGTGGACLIAQNRSTAKPCSSDDDCNKFPMTRAPSGLLYDPTDKPGRYGYCVRSSLEHGTCWWKPSYNNCKIPAFGPGKFVTPWITPYETLTLLRLPPNAKLSWRVVACLNGIDVDVPSDDGLKPCSETVHRPGEVMERFGDPR